MEDEPEQGALFELEGPVNSCVWLTGEGGVHVNLGSRDALAEKKCQWLAEIDYGECG